MHALRLANRGWRTIAEKRDASPSQGDIWQGHADASQRRDHERYRSEHPRTGDGPADEAWQSSGASERDAEEERADREQRDADGRDRAEWPRREQLLRAGQ